MGIGSGHRATSYRSNSAALFPFLHLSLCIWTFWFDSDRRTDTLPLSTYMLALLV